MKGYLSGCSHPNQCTSDSYSLGHACSVHLHLQLLTYSSGHWKVNLCHFPGVAFQSPLNWLGYLQHVPTSLLMIPFRTCITIYLILCLIGHSAHWKRKHNEKTIWYQIVLFLAPAQVPGREKIVIEWIIFKEINFFCCFQLFLIFTEWENFFLCCAFLYHVFCVLTVTQTFPKLTISSYPRFFYLNEKKVSLMLSISDIFVYMCKWMRGFQLHCSLLSPSSYHPCIQNMAGT